FLDALNLGARRLERLLGTHRLQAQLELLVLVALAAAALPLLRRGLQPGDALANPIDPVFAILWTIGIACAVGAAWQAKYHRLAALILMGGAGLATSLSFVWLSAPDLALTQLMVESVTTVLILLGLRWLPSRLEPRALGLRASLADRLRRGRDFIIALAAGGGVAMLAYALLTRPFPHSMASFFLERALAEGGGANVVNVLLVDFRGFDTMGEITVLGVVALTIFALLRRFRPAPDSIAIPTQQDRQSADDKRPERAGVEAERGYMMVPAVSMRLLFPIMTVVSIFFFMRGHNEPGGGFVAGLVMAVAIILQYIAGGTVWVEERLKLVPRRLIGLGLLVTVATGLGAWVFGYPFLTSHSVHPRIPLLGEVPLSSALFFDLGVYLLVVGATAVILISLAHQSIRSLRAAAPVDAGAAPAHAPPATGATDAVIDVERRWN
ncbi:MAG: DUF4040 domain-containing protein, partial [Burkholderiaceae bacterium]|nr:DUF4040 domain-containing protein [Burkholderiaceae bacterium]